MYSSAGLADWELLTVSVVCASAALIISGTIGMAVAYLFTREPVAVAAAAAATTRPAASEAAVEENKPRLAMG